MNLHGQYPSEGSPIGQTLPQKVVEPTKRREIDTVVHLLKGLAIIGVVGRHLANKHFPAPDRAILTSIGDFFVWVTPMFILLSGYLHGIAQAKRETRIWDLALHRGRRLLIPFVIVTFGLTLVYTFIENTGLLPNPGEPGLPFWTRWENTLLSRNHRVGEQLYFLPLVYLVSVVAACVVKGLRNRLWPLTFVAALLLVAALGFPEAFAGLPLHPPFWGWAKFAAGVAVYLLGYLVAMRRDLGLPLFFITSGVCLGAALTESSSVVAFMFPLALATGLWRLQPRSTVLEQIGQASGTIFLYHTPFLLQPLLVAVALLHSDSNALLAWFVLVVMVAALTRLHFILSRSRFPWLTY